MEDADAAFEGGLEDGVLGFFGGVPGCVVENRCCARVDKLQGSGDLCEILVFGGHVLNRGAELAIALEILSECGVRGKGFITCLPEVVMSVDKSRADNLPCGVDNCRIIWVRRRCRSIV